MAGPWEKYADTKPSQPQAAEDGPWKQYAPPGSSIEPMQSAPNEPAPAAGRDLGEELKRQLGLTGRYLATIPAGVGGAIGDFGFGAANLFGAGLKGPKPSEAYQKFLTQLGLPEPETPMEKGVAFASNMVGAAMDPANVAIAGAAFKPSPEAIKPNGETVRLANRITVANNPHTFTPGPLRSVSTEMPRLNVEEAAREGVKITPWDLAHLGGNLAMGRYGSAAANLLRMGAREAIHGRLSMPHSLFYPMDLAKMKMGAAEQMDLNSFLFDPYMLQQQQQELQR